MNILSERTAKVALKLTMPTASQSPTASHSFDNNCLAVGLACALTIASSIPNNSSHITPFSYQNNYQNNVNFFSTLTSGNRETTAQEKIIGEIRSWNELEDNWDGENGLKPVEASMEEATSFIYLLNKNLSLPEPMLLSSGRIALYWDEDDLYADIEFIGDGRVTFFIKRNEHEEKGIIDFDSQKMPTLFSRIFNC